MKHYIGIDLGTTNSVICSYDGQNVRIWKSPDQNDVTPSAIFVDKRGNRYYGRRAYEQAPYYPDNSAILFKRFMGTNTIIELKNANLSFTPEECSAEMLRVLYGYLPEEIRNGTDIATVITVPAAFNQMKKDATLKAAGLAGIGKVALMQEPVAAIMSIMQNSKQEGIFLVYDLGGGTFDVSIAENIGGKVNLLSHGGIEMCGGRDLDRSIFNQVVVPWLRDAFTFPDDLLTNPKYRALCRLAQWATEQAKIELSSNNESVIRMDESTLRCMDEQGNEVYINIPITRENLNDLINDLVLETIDAARDIMRKAGLNSNDIEKIVFIGGPTNYKTLRDKVSSELAIPANIEVNPMTAVAEGASIFAESIDWSSEKHNRKPINSEIKVDLDISFRYTIRTSDNRAKVMFLVNNLIGYTVEISSNDSGWSSGRIQLINGMTFELPLSRNGENAFSVIVYDASGLAIPLRDNHITITKTMATIGAIPASHSIGIEVKEKLGGASVIDFLVNEGDALPKKGHKTVKAGQTLKAGSASSINIKLWEGSIQNPIDDNRFIGMLKISGVDFDSGIIPTGAEIECDYEMSDSGAFSLSISIPCIGVSFGNRNFYSRQEAQVDFSDTDKLIDDSQHMLERIDAIIEKIGDPKLERAREKVQRAATMGIEVHDQEDTQKASNELLEAKRLVAQARQEHIKEIRQMDLDNCVSFFKGVVQQYSKAIEVESFYNLSKAAQRSIDRNDTDFDIQLMDLKRKNFAILWRQDWFIIDQFDRMVQNPYDFADRKRFEELKCSGQAYKKNDKFDELRDIVAELISTQITDNLGENMFDDANIIKG